MKWETNSKKKKYLTFWSSSDMNEVPEPEVPFCYLNK